MSFQKVPKMENDFTTRHEAQRRQQGPVAATVVQMPSAKEEDKMPLFLIKLWNIVEDPQYHEIIRWDESGLSFHIIDPYSFCHNVLPHYFKHNNINSLIRQLNMYGFRKMTPLDRGGLTRSESDQDHLEFSHPCFVRDHPDLLVNIKRKQSTRTNDQTTAGVQAQQNIQLVMDELKQMRDRQRQMDLRMQHIVKENNQLWEQMAQFQRQHNRQQQVVSKLVQFLVAMVKPNLSKRVLKRGVLAIDESPTKRPRQGSSTQASSNGLADILERLQRELVSEENTVRETVRDSPQSSNARGPIIADVTEELNSPLFANYGDHGHYTYSPQPSYPNSAQNGLVASKSKNAFPKGSNIAEKSPMLTVDKTPKQPPSFVANTQPTTSNAVVEAPFSPTITMSPSLDRQISQELQEYLNGVDLGLDNCRDLLGPHWDYDFFEGLDQDQNDQEAPVAGQLALEQAPAPVSESTLMPPLSDDSLQDSLAAEHMAHGNAINFDQYPIENPTLGQANVYPNTPELLTPCTSPFYPKDPRYGPQP